MPPIKNKREKAKFGIVGVVNTVIDFSFFFVFSQFLNPIIANYISTTISFSFSFVANKKFTFHSNNKIGHELVLFIVVTLTGLWVFQPLIIWGVHSVLDPKNMHETFILILSKVFATAFTLVWNYTLYSRVVFKKKVSDIS